MWNIYKLSDEQFELFFKNCTILAKIQNCAHELRYPISSEFLEVIGAIIRKPFAISHTK
jgi:hypothetical protein